MNCDPRGCATCRWAKVTCSQVLPRPFKPLLEAVGPAHCASHSQDEKLLAAFGMDGSAAVAALAHAQERVAVLDAEVARLTSRCAELERAKWGAAPVERVSPRRSEPAPVPPVVVKAADPTANDLLRLTSKMVGIPIKEIVGHARVAPILLVRAALAFVLRERGFTMSQIGALLGGRDHSTIISALKDGVQYRAREMYPQVYAAFKEGQPCRGR